ncbi:MAG: hypothetical protein WA192_13260 [Candidatus Acidiferrales bacterium]
MDLKKRNFIIQLFSMLPAAPLALLWSKRAFGQNSIPPLVPGSARSDDDRDQPFGGPAPPVDPIQILKQNKDQIHADVEKLYTLAGELKAEMEKTDSVNVLSLPMIQKAEQIEKLARQVKNLARG